MRYLTHVFIGFFFTAIGFIFIYYRQRKSADVMRDRNGEWRIPTNGLYTQVVTWIVENFPRWSSSFSPYGGEFDMEHPNYLDSSIAYIWTFGLAGVIFLIIVTIIFVLKFFCKKCGGKKIGRNGISTKQIDCYRYTILIFSFALVGFMIYGYFTNTELHSAVSSLKESFKNVSDQLAVKLENFKGYIDTGEIPAESPYPGVSAAELSADLTFTQKYAKYQIERYHGLIDKFEDTRMALCILVLIFATFGSSVGIAANAIGKTLPMKIMIILTTLGVVFSFFTFGAHFAGAKTLIEFCSEIESYISPGVELYLPMRLQFFVSCINTPFFSFFKDEFIRDAVQNTSKIGQQKNPQQTVFWFNLSSISSEGINQNDYAAAIKSVERLQLVDESDTCRWSKDQLYQDEFLLCVYSKDNLMMYSVTQFFSAICLIIITIVAFPAVKAFKYAELATFKPAKARR